MVKYSLATPLIKSLFLKEKKGFKYVIVESLRKSPSTLSIKSITHLCCHFNNK